MREYRKNMGFGIRQDEVKSWSNPASCICVALDKLLWFFASASVEGEKEYLCFMVVVKIKRDKIESI